MEKSDTVFLTTIFPASKKYLDDFFISLQKQTFKNFDILVVNDGVDNLNSYKTKYPDLFIIEIISELSHAKNREIGIKKALKLDYKFIAFGDSDDLFSENRIQQSIEALKHNDIVINELTLFSHNNRNENFLINHLKDINSLEEGIYNSNVFGFSNIAVRSEIIEPLISFDDNLVAVDWFFITTLLLEQQQPQIQFLREVQTYYRQHEDNTIGFTLLLTEEKLDIGIKVKQKHYAALIKYCKKKKYEQHLPIFENKLKQILELKEALTKPLFKEKYIQLVNSNYTTIFSGWWSEIITLEEFYKYENSNK